MSDIAVSSHWRASEPGMSSSYDTPESLKGLYTCLACQIGFHSADLQRQHYRTDWYRPIIPRVGLMEGIGII